MGAFDDSEFNFDGHADARLNAAVLQELLIGSDTLPRFLDELVSAVAGSTGHACGVTVRGSGQTGYFTVTSSSDVARGLDELQYVEDAGPCVQALETAQPVIVKDFMAEQRWPPYPARAVAMGARSSLSYPLISAGVSIGALNLYSARPADAGPGIRREAELMAGRLGGALALALRLAERDELIQTLQTALRSRSSIDQAMGVLMAQQRCEAEVAFGLLRRASQARNVKLREVAAQILASVASGGSRPGPDRY